MSQQDRQASAARFSRADAFALIAIGVFGVVTFLPWSYSSSFLGVGIIAWLMAASMVVMPAVGLVLALLEPEESNSEPQTHSSR